MLSTAVRRLGETSRTQDALVVLLGALSIAAAGVLVSSPTVATSGPLLAVLGVMERRRRLNRARRRAQVGLLPSVVDRLVQQLRAGRSLPQSCAQIGNRPGQPLEPEAQLQLAPLLDGLASQRPLIEAANSLVINTTDSAVRLFAVTLRVLAANGGPGAPALQRLRQSMIATVNGHDQAAAQSAQAMASAGFMVASPAMAAVAVAALHRPTARLYLFEVVGAACVFVAISLSATGWWWLQRTVTGMERRLI